MKHKISLLVLSFVMFGLSLWAYPIYDLGSSDLKGLDQSEVKKDLPKYVFVQNISENEYNALTPPKGVSTPFDHKDLRVCYKPYYLRLVDKNEKTLWKSTNLYAGRKDDSWEDEPNGPADNVEYWAYPIREIESGMLLYDIKNKCYVFKENNGNEIRYPSLVGDFGFYQLYDGGKQVLDRQFVFINYGNGRKFELAIINYDGSFKCRCNTDIDVKHADEICLNKTSDRLLVIYTDEKDRSGLMVISTEGKLLRNYSNFNPGNVLHFNQKAPDYAMLRLSEIKGRCILDTKSGEIVAGFDYDHLDMTQVDDKLIAIISRGPGIFVIDVLSGKLIQDFTDLGQGNNLRKYEIVSIRISPDAKSVWYHEQYPDKSSKYFYYRMLD